MTENLRAAMLAIHEFVWTAINYESVLYQFKSSDRETYIPRFVAEPNWSCNTDHMASKWIGIAEDDAPGYGRLVKFYLQLDNGNQLALMEWILNNPVDKRELSIKED